MTSERWKADLNRVEVSVDDLRRAAHEVHQLAPEDRNWEGRLFAMVRVFKGEPNKGLAVEYRLVAMSRTPASSSAKWFEVEQAPR